jgi:F420-dependent oxidoreductase-like protein
MKLGLQLGYWGAGPPAGAAELVAEADRVGFDAVFAAESWGSDAFTPLAWWGSATERIRLGTSVAQLSARAPTACAMHALTLDHLSGGRAILGLGVSGPQVVEGWYGAPFGKPLARTREYVSIIRQVLAREAPVRSDGPHYPLPYHGPGAEGWARPLRPIVHPLRADLPIWLGAEGPRNVALAAEIADGWLAIYFSPRLAGMYTAGWTRASRGRVPGAAGPTSSRRQHVGGDHRRPAAEIDRLRPMVALYAGEWARRGATSTRTCSSAWDTGRPSRRSAAVPAGRKARRPRRCRTRWSPTPRSSGRSSRSANRSRSGRRPA